MLDEVHTGVDACQAVVQGLVTGRGTAARIKAAKNAAAMRESVKYLWGQGMQALEVLWSMHAYNTCMALGVQLGVVLPGSMIKGHHLQVLMKVARMCSDAAGFLWHDEDLLEVLETARRDLFTIQKEGGPRPGPGPGPLGATDAMAATLRDMDRDIDTVQNLLWGQHSPCVGLCAAFSEFWHRGSANNSATGVKVSVDMQVETQYLDAKDDPHIGKHALAAKLLEDQGGVGVSSAIPNFPVWVAYHRAVIRSTVHAVQCVQALVEISKARPVNLERVALFASIAMQRSLKTQALLRHLPPVLKLPGVIFTSDDVALLVGASRQFKTASDESGRASGTFTPTSMPLEAPLGTPTDMEAHLGQLRRLGPTLHPVFVGIMTAQWVAMARRCRACVTAVTKDLVPVVVKGLAQVVDLFHEAAEAAVQCPWVVSAASIAELELAMSVCLKMVVVHVECPPVGVVAEWDAALAQVWDSLHKMLQVVEHSSVVGATAGAGTGGKTRPGDNLLRAEASASALMSREYLYIKLAHARCTSHITGTEEMSSPLADVMVVGIMAIRRSVDGAIPLVRKVNLLACVLDRAWALVVPDIQMHILPCVISLVSMLAATVLEKFYPGVRSDGEVDEAEFASLEPVAAKAKAIARAEAEAKAWALVAEASTALKDKMWNAVLATMDLVTESRRVMETKALEFPGGGSDTSPNHALGGCSILHKAWTLMLDFALRCAHSSESELHAWARERVAAADSKARSVCVFP